MNKTETANVKVMVAGLQQIPTSQFYALQDSTGAVIGAIQGKHTANHYLTEPAIGKLNDFAIRDTATNRDAQLYLNDASLVWGGLFDVGSIPWSPPHSTHRHGSEIDIRAQNSGANNEGAVPTTLFSKLSKSAAQAGAKAALHCVENGVLKIGTPCSGIPNNRHFHINF